MKTKIFLAAAMAATALAANAQNTQNTPAVSESCRCGESFEWLRSTFETNDAGFGYIVERKGRAAYELHNAMTLEKIKAVESERECRTLMTDWLRFFRRGHIGLQRLPSAAPAAQSAPQTSAPNAGSEPQPEMWNGDIAEFERQMAAKQEADDYEGVWEHYAGLYTLGIKAKGDGYIGFMTQNPKQGEPGEVQMRIIRDGDKWQTIYYYMGGETTVGGKPKVIEQRLLNFGGQMLRRVSPALPADPEIDNYGESVSARMPYVKELNPTTLYMRIPSFDQRHKPAIDRMIADSFDKLTSTENLIIDVRNNGGGSDMSYKELRPLLYTDPVRTPAVSFLSTPLNIENQRYLLDREGLDEESRERIATLIEKMKNHPGEFVPIGDEAVDIEIQDTVYEYPRRIGILIDGGCGSTTEQFLLAAKQSKKVKLFGTTTFGTLDASNVRTVDSPDGRYRLSYTTSLSARIPDMAIDDIGLQPDFYLDKTIPDYRWVEFVSETLNR
jgi:hypothetical protein